MKISLTPLLCSCTLISVKNLTILITTFLTLTAAVILALHLFSQTRKIPDLANSIMASPNYESSSQSASLNPLP